MAEAHQAQAESTTQTAENYLKYLIQRNPTQAKTRILLGRLYLEQGNPEAEQELELARRLGADPKEVLPLLGHSLLAQGKARAVLERIKPSNPTSSSLRAQIAVLYGQAQLMLGQFDAATASFIEALASESTSGMARVGLAWAALARSNLDQAEAEATRALSLDARLTEAWLAKAEVSRLRGRSAEAERAFARVLVLAPFNLSARLGRAAMALAQHQPETAAEDLRVASQIAPQNPLLNRLHGLLAYERGDLAGAIEALHQMLTTDQEGRSTTHLLGTLIDRELMAEHYQAVLLTARRLQGQAPQAALGYTAEGTVRMAQQDWGGAARVLTAAYQREPNARLALNLYIARSNSKESGAEAILESWFSAHPENIETRITAAIALQQNGQRQMAQAYYEKALETQSDHPVALNNLAWLYLEDRDPRALSIAELAYRQSPNNPQVLDTYGWVLVNEGDPQRGLFPLQQAVSGAPQDGSIRYHWAVALVQIGRSEDARQELEKLLHDLATFPQRSAAQALLARLQPVGLVQSDSILTD
ncbi:hypothetical protein CCP3SC1_310035 [Gammaproteobacteria bacterium]